MQTGWKDGSNLHQAFLSSTHKSFELSCALTDYLQFKDCERSLQLP